jgi:hypothetical protein
MKEINKTISIYDRVTGNLIQDSLPEYIEFGRYIMYDTKGASFLSPQDNNSIYIESSRKIIQYKFTKFIIELLEDKQILKNLELISQEIQNKNIDSVVPLIREVSNDLEPNKLDKLIKNYYMHIQQIAYKPEIKLKNNYINLPVSRSKKIPRKAIEKLSARSGDWQKRTLNSIVPKNILSTVMEDEIVFYENKIVVQLIKNIIYYIQKKKRFIKNLNDFNTILEKILSSTSNEKQLWSKKINRNYKLCGEAYLLESNLKLSESTLKELEHLERNFLKLINSILYQSMPNELHLEKSLKKTNLFDNHKHYKYIPFLWNQYIVDNMQDSEKDIYQRYQSLNIKFYDFCYLIIIRSLHYLGFLRITENNFNEINLYNTKNLYKWIQSISLQRDETKSIKLIL